MSAVPSSLSLFLSRAGQGALLRLRAVAQRETSGNDDKMYVYTALVVNVIVVIVFLSVPVWSRQYCHSRHIRSYLVLRNNLLAASVGAASSSCHLGRCGLLDAIKP